MQVHHWLSRVYMRVHCIQVTYTYTHTFTKGKACILWKNKFLVHGILIHGIGPRYQVRGVDPRYLVQGIGPKWFWSMVLRKA